MPAVRFKEGTMVHAPRFVWVVTLVACWLTGPGLAHAYSIRTDDKAKLFSKAAAAEADDKNEGLRLKYRKDIRIQTFERVPFFKDPMGRVKKMDEAARARFFEDWATSQARKSYTDGIYVLICKTPLNVQVVLEQHGKSKPFTAEDVETLRKEIYKLVQENHADAALHFAITHTETRLAEWLNVNGERVLPVNYDWAGLVIILLAVVGAWLALFFLHGFSEGTFPSGNAGVNPICWGIGGQVFSGLRALRGGGSSHAVAGAAPPDARTILDEPHAGDSDAPAPEGGA
jgi:hypothetical protein